MTTDTRTPGQRAYESLMSARASRGALGTVPPWGVLADSSRRDWEAAAAAVQAPQEPVAWTLTETPEKRKTTAQGYLWFTDPVNSSWTPLFSAPVGVGELVGAGRPAWVPVSERLPEPDTGEVLVWLTGGRAAFDEWHTHREDPTGMGGATLDMGLMWRDYEFEEITHWQPITPPGAAAPVEERRDMANKLRQMTRWNLDIPAIRKAADMLAAAPSPQAQQPHPQGAEELAGFVRLAVSLHERMTDERVPADERYTAEKEANRVVHRLAWIAEQATKPVAHPQGAEPAYTYASTQATSCAGCGERKHTPLRIDAMGGYVCLTCIDKKLGGLLGEFGYEEESSDYIVDGVAWEAFLKDYERYANGDPKMPWNEIRTGLAVVIESARPAGLGEQEQKASEGGDHER